MALAAAFYLVLCITANLVRCQTTSTNPAFVPLAVRSPYLNAWMTTRAANGSLLNSPAGYWPTSWSGKVLGWGGLVRVDGHSYLWQGYESGINLTNTISSYVTPTRTIFTVAAGPMRLNVTYLSPVEPSNWVKQSFPFSYLSIDAWSTDGNSHDVQVYSDVTGEWLSDMNADLVQWGSTETGESQIQYIQRTIQSPFAESNNFAEDGTLYLAMPKSRDPNISWQSGASSDLRNQFVQNGRLNKTVDSNFRQIQGVDFPVIAFAANLGTVSITATPVVFGLGYVRDPVIRTVTPDGPQERSSYYWTKYDKIEDAIDDFLNGFAAATDRAISLDSQTMSAAQTISTEYADLVALSLRPAFAAMDITVSRSSSNQLNASDVKAYMKDVGTSGRVNAVETLYANLPVLLYLNATLARLLLEPLLDFQDSALYNNGYAAPDLGTTYPDVKGNTTDQSALAFENCGSMLVMVMAYTQKSGDGSLLQRHYKLLKTWADYLITNNLVQPTKFLTADGLIVSLSNLVLKSISGIQAMSSMNHILEPLGTSSNDTQLYAATAQAGMVSWRRVAFTTDHVMSAYGATWSWDTLYNAYAPKLLNVSLIDPSILSTESAWYTKQALTADTYGFGFDYTQKRARADWLMFTAAVMPDTSVRDSLISMVHTRAFWNGSSTPWPKFYLSDNGTALHGTSSPALGAMYALLAADIPDKTIQIDTTRGLGNPASATDATGPKKNIAAIVGGAIGVFLLGLLAGIVFWLRKRSQRKAAAATHDRIAIPFNSGGPMVIETFPKYRDTSPVPPGGERQPLSKAQEAGLSNPNLTAIRTQDHDRRRNANSLFNADSAIHDEASGLLIGGSGSHSYPPSTSSNAGNDSTTHSLRHEVEQLRQEMAALRMGVELPPTYTAAT